jgi:hypothetical protein
MISEHSPLAFPEQEESVSLLNQAGTPQVVIHH